jgi:hypothetical protein
MEIVATEEETRVFVQKYSHHNQFLVFPKFIRNTTRESVRMPQLPYIYYKYGPQQNLSIEQVQPGQYAVVEIGIFPFAQMNNIRLRFRNLTSGSSQISSFEVIELGGFDMHGNIFKKIYNIAKLQVGFVTVGIDIPKNTKCGVYKGQITVSSESLTQESTIDVFMNVSCKSEPIDRINDIWSLQRLKWLNSRIGIDDDFLPEPFTPIEVEQSLGINTVNILNRQIILNKIGLPDQILSNGNAILSSPMKFVAEFALRECDWKPSHLDVQKKSASFATVSSSAVCSDGSLNITVNALLTYDGVIDYTLVVTPALNDVEVKDIRLEYEQRSEVATYSSGQSWDGGYYRPTSYVWRDIDPICKGDGVSAAYCQGNQVWIGEYNAGLKIKLKGNTPIWDNPRMNWTDYSINNFPKSWGNLDGSGGLKTDTSSEGVTVTAYSGRRILYYGESVEFNFNLVVTPVKSQDFVGHFNNQRYFHTAYGDWSIPVSLFYICFDVNQNLDELKYLGVNTVIFHQSNALNARINYPAHPATAEALGHYIKAAHERGLKVKVYFTNREISNAIVEMWSMKNLNGEIFDSHMDYGLKGNAWLQEHLVSGYSRAWFTAEPNFEEDASIHLLGISDTGGRYANYYIETLRWLIEVLDVDGIYYDGLTFDYLTMMRARKLFRKLKPESYLDLDQNPLTYVEVISSIDTLCKS